MVLIRAGVSSKSFSTVGGIAGSPPSSLSFLSEANAPQSRIPSSELPRDLFLPSNEPLIDLHRLNAIDPWYSSILEEWKLRIPEHLTKDFIQKKLTENRKFLVDIVQAIKQRQHLLLQDFIFRAFARGEPLAFYQQAMIDFVCKEHADVWAGLTDEKQKNECLDDFKSELAKRIIHDQLKCQGARLDKKYFTHFDNTLLRSTTGNLYKLVNGEVLGKGANGKVRYICDFYTGVFAVKKMVLKQPKINFECLKLIPDDPYFAKIYDHIVTPWGDKQKYYLVMELVNGNTLSKYLEIFKKNGMPNKMAVNTFLKKLAYLLCDALRMLSENDLAHRDIKPDNLMITTEGKLKVIDLDRVVSNRFNPLKPFGTRGYLPPDLSSEPSYLVSAHDQFSCGVTLLKVFFYLTQRRNYLICHSDVSNEVVLCLDERSRSYPGFTGTHQLKGDCLEDIIAMLMTRDPNQRPSFAHILQQPYFAEWRTV